MMKRILTFTIASFIALSCTAKNKEEGLQIPIIKYNPATYLSDIDRALADPTSFECMSADSQQLSGIDEDILVYISDQDAFIVSLTYGETESAPKVRLTINASCSLIYVRMSSSIPESCSESADRHSKDVGSAKALSISDR